MPVKFTNVIDVGHILTLIALAAGFLGWIYATQREWRRTTRDDARSGALRLLLRILRQQKGVPISLSTLHENFKSEGMKPLRIAYCKRDWKFKTDADFESAIYRLDWEGKIFFVSQDEILFRVDPNRTGTGQFHANSEDKKFMLQALEGAITNLEINAWDLEKLAQSCMQVAPEPASQLLHDGLKSTNEKVRLRVASIIGKLAANN